MGVNSKNAGSGFTGDFGFSPTSGGGGFDFGELGVAAAGGIPGLGAYAAGKGVDLLGGFIKSIFGSDKGEKAFERESKNLSALGEEDFLDPFAIARFARKESRSELKDAASKLSELSGGMISDFDLFGALREGQADELGSNLAGLEERNQTLTSSRKTQVQFAKFNAALAEYMQENA